MLPGGSFQEFLTKRRPLSQMSFQFFGEAPSVLAEVLSQIATMFAHKPHKPGRAVAPGIFAP